MNDKQRIFYLDVARVVAIISITFNHAVNRSYDNYSKVVEEFNSISWYSTLIKAIVTQFSTLGVPLFLMITGALLLNRNYDTKPAIHRFYTHNYLNILITSEIWLFLGYWFLVLAEPSNKLLELKGISGAIRGCIKNIFLFDMVKLGSTWYILMIFCIYLLIPVIALFLHKSPSPKVILIPVILLIFISFIVPAVNTYLPLLGIAKKEFALDQAALFSHYLIYVLIGYYLSNQKFRWLPSPILIIAFIVSYCINCGLQFFCYSWSNHLLWYDSPGVLICSVLLFETIRRFGDKLIALKKPITYLSSISFAIYLSHMFIMNSFNWYFDFSGWKRPVKLFFLDAVAVIGSVLFIWIFSHIPFCKKRLFLIK